MIFKTDVRNADRRGRRAIMTLLLLTATIFLSACGEKTVATAGSEFEANLMLDILHTNGLRADKKQAEADLKTWNVTVDEGWFGEDEAATAIQVLRDYGLPRPPEPEIQTGDSPLGGFTDREEKARQRRSLQRQIEAQLYTLPDVIRADVIIAQPTDDIMSLEKTPSSASVTLVLKETQPKFTIEAVQNLISGDVEKLKPENVKVLISQQSLREIPLEKLALQRRSKAIYTIGGGIVIFLTCALGAVLYLSKRRKDGEETEDETARLTDGDEAGDGAFDKFERPLLNGETDYEDAE